MNILMFGLCVVLCVLGILVRIFADRHLNYFKKTYPQIWAKFGNPIRTRTAYRILNKFEKTQEYNQLNDSELVARYNLKRILTQSWLVLATVFIILIFYMWFITSKH